jgi:hypothetical protein
MGREKPITSLALHFLCLSSNTSVVCTSRHFLAPVLPLLASSLANEIRAKIMGERNCRKVRHGGRTFSFYALK